MKILITGDNHIDFIYDKDVFEMFFKSCQTVQPDVIINLGDLVNSWMVARQRKAILSDILNCKTLYVPGNHDLWSPHARSKLNPEASFDKVLNEFSCFDAQPLETSFDDMDTVKIFKDRNCAFVGTMGFPDFSHKKLVMPQEYYEKRLCTNDGTYIDLTHGWLIYTHKILSSFKKRVQKAIDSDCKYIVVATHYPIFEGQSMFDGSDISAYFFCHEAGEIIRRFALDYPDRKFACFAAHSHDYCRGRLTQEDQNIVSYGLQADYRRLTFIVFDTEQDSIEPETFWFRETPRWAASYLGSIIESR